MPLLDKLIGSAAAAPIDALAHLFDRLFTSDEERAQAEAVAMSMCGWCSKASKRGWSRWASASTAARSTAMAWRRRSWSSCWNYRRGAPDCQP